MHTKFGSQIHKILFDNTMKTGVKTSAVAQNNYIISVRVLCPQVLIPYSFYIVADKLGSVLTRTYRYISHIPYHIVDSVNENLAIGECPEIVIKGFRLTNAKTFLSLLKFPMSSFFFVSMLIMERPIADVFSLMSAIFRN